MTKQEILTTTSICVYPETEIGQAARLMRDRRVSAPPVSDGERIFGIATERNNVVDYVAEKETAGSVSSIMTPSAHPSVAAVPCLGLRLVPEHDHSAWRGVH